MTFMRTKEGIENYVIFLDVDMIIFCEGGQNTIRIEDALNDEPQEALDVIYWELRFAQEKPDKRATIRPLGGKESVVEAHKNLNDCDENLVVFAIDKDYDEILGRCLEHDNVFYTHGYSIENDIFSRDGLKELFFRIFPEKRNDKAEKFASEVESRVLAEISKIRRYIYIDIALRENNQPSLFGGSFDRFIREDSEGCPEIALAQMRESAKKSIEKKELKSATISRGIIPRVDLQGHSLFDFLFRVIAWGCRKHGRQRIQFQKEMVKGWLCNAAGASDLRGESGEAA